MDLLYLDVDAPLLLAAADRGMYAEKQRRSPARQHSATHVPGGYLALAAERQDRDPSGAM